MACGAIARGVVVALFLMADEAKRARLGQRRKARIGMATRAACVRESVMPSARSRVAARAVRLGAVVICVTGRARGRRHGTFNVVPVTACTCDLAVSRVREPERARDRIAARRDRERHRHSVRAGRLGLVAGGTLRALLRAVVAGHAAAGCGEPEAPVRGGRPMTIRARERLVNRVAEDAIHRFPDRRLRHKSLRRWAGGASDANGRRDPDERREANHRFAPHDLSSRQHGMLKRLSFLQRAHAADAGPILIDRLVTSQAVGPPHLPAVRLVTRAALIDRMPAEPAMKRRERVGGGVALRGRARLVRVLGLLLFVRVVAAAAVPLVRVCGQVERENLLHHLVARRTIQRLGPELESRLRDGGAGGDAGFVVVTGGAMLEALPRHRAEVDANVGVAAALLARRIVGHEHMKVAAVASHALNVLERRRIRLEVQSVPRRQCDQRQRRVRALAHVAFAAHG